jgi:hypothetical protein
MGKPLVIAKRPGPEWSIDYISHDTDEEHSMSVFGSVTISDALQEARSSLDALMKDWYTITSIKLITVDDETAE